MVCFFINWSRIRHLRKNDCWSERERRERDCREKEPLFLWSLRVFVRVRAGGMVVLSWFEAELRHWSPPIVYRPARKHEGGAQGCVSLHECARSRALLHLSKRVGK